MPGKKGQGLVKELVWMPHGHGQQGGDWLWEQAGRLGVGGHGENWEECSRKHKNKK